MDDVYPIFLRLNARPVLIVGGGAVALRKAEGLLIAGALVTVVSLEFHPGFAALSAVQCITSAYETHYLALPGAARWTIVFAATNNESVNARIYADSVARGILCCRCDMPMAGDFIGPAVQRCGPVTLAVTSGGASPGLSGKLARQLTHSMDPVLIQQIQLSAGWRQEVLQQVSDVELRRKLLQRLSGEFMRDTLRKAGETEAEKLFQQWLTEAMNPSATLADPATEPRV